MPNTLHLYRGDDINNDRTKPAIYRSEGIISSAFGSFGDPLNIERIGFLETIKTHVDHVKDFELNYYKITDYISFSENEDTAKAFSARFKPENLIPCPEAYKETRYVFHVKIPFDELIPITAGVWEYKFKCNPNLKQVYKLNEDEPFETIAHNWALTFVGCETCGAMQKNHSMLVINPLLILNELPEQKKYKRAKNLILKNNEWLLLPNDIINFGHRGTRIQLADFWDVHGYTIKGEAERNPFSVPYPGY